MRTRRPRRNTARARRAATIGSSAVSWDLGTPRPVALCGACIDGTAWLASLSSRVATLVHDASNRGGLYVDRRLENRSETSTNAHFARAKPLLAKYRVT